MMIPHNQQLGHTWLIEEPNPTMILVLDQQKLSIPGLECSGRTKQIM